MFFLVLWKYIKAYWKYALAIVLAVVGFILFSRKGVTLSGTLEKIFSSHEQELKDISNVRAEETAQHEANKKSYDDKLEVIKKEHDEKTQELEDKKKKEIDKILKSSGEDPTKLAQELSSETGFKIILPESKKDEIQ